MTPGQAAAPHLRELRVEKIVKKYSGVPVLHGVSLAVRPGEVLGLVGHNGAGKSTLLKVLSGATNADEGSIKIDGRAQEFSTPADALSAGIATVYQELSLLDNLSVTQNIFLGDEQTKANIMKRSQMRSQAKKIASDFGLEIDVDAKLGTYPVAIRQLLEIAVAMHRDAQYLLLDEPTTSLEGRQVDNFLEVVKELAVERNMGILMVNHKMDELYAVANRVAALVDGELKIDASVDEVSREDVIAAIVGEEETSPEASSQPDSSEALVVDERLKTKGIHLQASNLKSASLNNFSLEAKPGRVLGVYGLIGSGRTEFLRSLIGIEKVNGGEILLDGQRFTPRGPRDSQERGVVYLTEERKLDGIVARLDGVTNVALPILEQHRRFGLLNLKSLRRESRDYLKRLRVRGNISNPTESLSGGNQQKVLLARALLQKPRLLLLDEPTKGVDIGVKAEIHRMIKTLAHEDGITVVLVSSEEEEVAEVADDVVVASHGHCSGELLAESERTAQELRHAAWSTA